MQGMTDNGQVKIPRKRGGQPGNWNAARHGRYSRQLREYRERGVQPAALEGLEEQVRGVAGITWQLYCELYPALQSIRWITGEWPTLSEWPPLGEWPHLGPPEEINDARVRQLLRKLVPALRKLLYMENICERLGDDDMLLPTALWCLEMQRLRRQYGKH